MSPMARHLWLNLVEMKDVDKAHFLDAPISQAGLFGDTIEGFAQQFSAVQQQTEAIQHTAATGARPQSAHHRGRPPASSRAAPPQAESIPWPARRASRRRVAPPRVPARPQVIQEVNEADLMRENPEMLEFALSQETARTAPLLPLVEGREENLQFLFRCWSKGQRYPLSQERAISFSSGFSGPWDDSVRCPASSLSPTTHFASSQESKVRGRHSSPRTSGQSRLGPREFGEDASEPLLPFAAPPQVCRLCRWSRLHSVWRRGSRCPACLAGSRAQFDSATRFSSPGDLPSSTAFSRRWWQSGTPLSYARRLLSSWQRTQSSRSLQPRGGRGFTALTSSYPRNVVAFDQSWICDFWTGLYTSSRSRCGCADALSNASSPRIGLQRSTWRMLTFMFRSFCDTDRSYGLRSKVGHGNTGSSPSGSPCLPVCPRRS